MGKPQSHAMLPFFYLRAYRTRRMSRLESFIQNERRNAIAAWVLVALLSLAVLQNVFDGDLLWAGFAAVAVALALVPVAATGDRSVTVPAEVLAFAALPVLSFSLGLPSLVTQIGTYLGVVALGLLVVLSLHEFTPVEMTPWFAISFTVLTTMAVAAVWVVARWFSDQFLGTSFVTGQTAIMWDLTIATGVAVVAGPAFRLYFEHRDETGSREVDIGGEPQ